MSYREKQIVNYYVDELQPGSIITGSSQSKSTYDYRFKQKYR